LASASNLFVNGNTQDRDLLYTETRMLVLFMILQGYLGKFSFIRGILISYRVNKHVLSGG